MREGQGIAAGLLRMSDVRLETVGETAIIRLVPHAVTEPPTLPADLQTALELHPEARVFFDKMSASKQKIFVDQVEQTPDEATRAHYIAEIVRQLERVRQFQKPQM